MKTNIFGLLSPCRPSEYPGDSGGGKCEENAVCYYPITVMAKRVCVLLSSVVS